ncbi:hypothetical protein [Pantoea wallisii]|uniref:MrpH family fimbial adhesin n=1 Tax=Pantoea wallisii TaxID=1076551 RepID=UPI000FFB2E4C|nr:hypothetical protein [Pantoea wallisii]
MGKIPGFIFLFLSMVNVQNINAASLVPALTKSSVSGSYVNYTMTVNYNPNGVAAPSKSPQLCAGANPCTLEFYISYRYVVTQIKNGYPSETYFNGGIGVVPSHGLTYDGKASWSEATTAWKNKYGSSITYSGTAYLGFTPSPPGVAGKRIIYMGICVVGVGSPGNNNEDKNACGRSYPSISCNYDNSVLLDHGNLILGAVNGNKRTGALNINCSGDLPAKFLLLPNTINLAPGLTSKITVNNSSDEQVIPLTSGVNTINIASTLTDSGAKPGPFQGSTTLLISYQ